jgi:hypothetical protein
MSTVSHEIARVQPTLAEIAAGWSPEEECEPFISPEDTFVVYEPSRADSAFWTAFNAANDGDTPECPTFRGVDSDACTHSFCLGARVGLIARESREAEALGYEVGLISELRMPPGGYAPHQAAAYSVGFARGRAEDDARTEAQIEHLESQAMEDHYYRAGLDLAGDAGVFNN